MGLLMDHCCIYTFPLDFERTQETVFQDLAIFCIKILIANIPNTYKCVENNITDT